MRKDAPIKRTLLDGLYRYYPQNYHLSTDPKPNLLAGAAKVISELPLPEPSNLYKPSEPTGDRKVVFNRYEPAPKIDLESLAKDFYWETSSKDLIEFINWYKAR